MLIGTNADPQHGFLPADIVQSDVWLTRFPLSLGFDYGPFIAGLLGAQIRPVPVIHSNSFRPKEWLSQSFGFRLQWWKRGLPDPQYIQAGNEPDGTGDSSSRQTRDNYFRLVDACQHNWPNATILGAGLVGIDFSYYGSNADIECFHPYTQDAETVITLIDAIKNSTDKPLWATEVGVPKRFYPTLHERAVWHSDMLVSLWEQGIEGAINFPYGEVMEPNFDGMVDLGREPTEIWAAVQGAILPLHGSPPENPPPLHAPAMSSVAGNVAGRFGSTPQGIILHATRSGQAWSEANEFATTVSYVMGGANGLGWHCSVGPGLLCTHIDPGRWGWNAREASPRFLAIEFAQGQLGGPISDSTLDAAAYWIREYALKQWPDLPMYLPMHSELPPGIRDGKTDIFERSNQVDADNFRARLLAKI